MRLLLLYLTRRHPSLAGTLSVLTLALATGPGLAEEAPVEPVYYVADIELHTADEFSQLLDRAERLLLESDTAEHPAAREDAIVTLVLHGPVLESLLRENYRQNKALVDQAASLSALEVIDVKACKSWMAYNGIDPARLHPFVEVVAYGPAEVERLVEERGYLYF